MARILGSLFAAGVSVTLLATQAHQPVDVGYIHPATTVDPMAALIRVHGCWTDTAPADMAGKFPTHAIVDGRYVGKRITDLAFDQEIGGHDHSLTVAAFCR